MEKNTLRLFLAIFITYDGIHALYQCHIGDVASVPFLDENKLSLEWYLQAVYPAPSSPRGGYKDYSYSIEPSPGGLTVKVDGIRTGEDKCMRQGVEMWRRKHGQAAVYTYQRGHVYAESVIVYTDYKRLLVELVCINPRGGVCQESEVAIFTRMRVGDDADIRQGMELAPGQCIMDASKPVRIAQDITTFPCQRKVNRQCNFDQIPIERRPEYTNDAGPFASLWYVPRNYPSSYRERTFFGNFLAFNCSLRAFTPQAADFSCPYTYRPPEQDQCIQGDLDLRYRFERLAIYDFLETSVDVNVTVKTVFFDTTTLVVFTCYKLTGNICENYSIRLFTKTPKPSPESIRIVEDFVKDGNLCTDPEFYYEAPNRECTDVKYVGNVKAYLENMRKARRSPDNLTQQHIQKLKAETESLKAEREMHLAKKEKLALEIQLLQRHLQTYG